MDWYWYINKSPYFIQIFIVIPKVLFLFQDPIQDTHCIYLSGLLKLFFVVTDSQTFFVSDVVDSFEENWLGIWGALSDVFLMIRLKYVLGR